MGIEADLNIDAVLATVVPTKSDCDVIFFYNC